MHGYLKQARGISRYLSLKEWVAKIRGRVAVIAYVPASELGPLHPTPSSASECTSPLRIKRGGGAVVGKMTTFDL
jgi:hypothetical protein